MKSYTKTYFASNSIKQWIDENLEPVASGSLDLKNILTQFEEATDKKMTVKELKKELEELNFVVRKGDYGFVLKYWKEKERETKESQETQKSQETKNIDVIDIEHFESIEE